MFHHIISEEIQNLRYAIVLTLFAMLYISQFQSEWYSETCSISVLLSGAEIESNKAAFLSLTYISSRVSKSSSKSYQNEHKRCSHESKGIKQYQHIQVLPFHTYPFHQSNYDITSLFACSCADGQRCFWIIIIEKFQVSKL